MNDEVKKPSFIIYRSWMEMVMDLPDEQALDLIRSIFAHCLEREYAPGAVATAIYSALEPILDADIAKWYKTRSERVEAGRKGGEAKAVANAKQMVANAKQMPDFAKQNVPVYVSVSDSVSESVSVSDGVSVSEEKEDTIVSKKEVRHRLGTYKNVPFTDSELEKLKEEFPVDWQDRIERVSEYMESKGVKYKSGLATIRTWARKDADRNRGKKQADILLDWIGEEAT